MSDCRSINWSQFERLGEVAEDEDIGFLLSHLSGWPDDGTYFDFLENSMLDGGGVEIALRAWLEHKRAAGQPIPQWAVKRAIELPCDWTTALVLEIFPETMLKLADLCHLYEHHGHDDVLPLIAERVALFPREFESSMTDVVLESMAEADESQQLAFVKAMPLKTAVITKILRAGGWNFTGDAAFLLACRATVVKPAVPVDAYEEVLGEIGDDERYLQLYALAKKYHNRAYMKALHGYADEDWLALETITTGEMTELVGYALMAKEAFFSNPSPDIQDELDSLAAYSDDGTFED